MWMVLLASLLVVNALQAEEAKITVLNPRGAPPPIHLVPMAPRLDTLAGKTIYIVDARFPDTYQLLEEMQKLFAKKYPEAKWVLKKKSGAYAEDDPKLWAEIKEKGHAMIMGVGH
jgi:hypothetical protein